MKAYEFEIPKETMVKVSIHLRAEELIPLVRHLDTLRNSCPTVPQSESLTRVMDAFSFAASATSPNVFEIEDLRVDE